MTTTVGVGARVWRRRTIVLCLLLALPLSMVLATGFGATEVPVDEIAGVFADRLSGESGSSVASTIVWDIRTPRVLLAAIVGAGLALAGAMIQTLVRNPLADPYLLGISSGASVGATAVITLGVLSSAGLWALTGGALLGALGAAVLVFGISIAQGGLTPLRLVLTGTVLSAAFSAVASFLVFRSAEPQAAQSVLFWLLGSLAGASWIKLVGPLAVVLLVGIVVWILAGWLDALAMGADAAASLGVPVVALRIGLFIAQAILVGVLVSVAGGIGFVGLVVPHLARMLVGARHRVLIPVAMLAGALFLVWVDVAARVLAPPMEIPLSVVTGLIGAPVFLAVLGRRRYRFGDAT
ncbi:iron ABC transporter permease [Aeromicrobium sp. YIM 150415]|uniref:FecCD family ABC transporter permease n=1 Tax=Aeromicrobium sp. YIM 150415 TaxID=2803912 RepID=UPI0019637E52|nr:iron ABC transporter permease [Aeromicrobium sp. YIM 150415]MBM9465318.1 iron ABC transporter permease [Aeromicrobium sp. YIM 150415]